MKICALKFSKKSRERITTAKGKCITFNQIAINTSKGENAILLRVTRDKEAKKHFCKAPNTKPYVRSKGRKLKRGRGRRRSRGYKAEINICLKLNIINNLLFKVYMIYGDWAQSLIPILFIGYKFNNIKKIIKYFLIFKI
jgi:hypothetical protein